MKKRNSIKASRRYYLHRKVKKVARLFAANGTGIIYVPFPLPDFGDYQKYIDELREVGYSVQTEIV